MSGAGSERHACVPWTVGTGSSLVPEPPAGAEAGRLCAGDKLAVELEPSSSRSCSLGE